MGRARRSKDAKILLRVLNLAWIARGMSGKAALRIGFTRAGGHLQRRKLSIGALSLGIGDITRSIILGEGVTHSNTMTMTVTIIASVILKNCSERLPKPPSCQISQMMTSIELTLRS